MMSDGIGCGMDGLEVMGVGCVRYRWMASVGEWNVESCDDVLSLLEG